MGNILSLPFNGIGMSIIGIALPTLQYLYFTQATLAGIPAF